MTKAVDIAGNQYGDLTALRCVKRRSGGNLWECIDSQGATLIVPLVRLTKGLKSVETIATASSVERRPNYYRFGAMESNGNT